MTGSFVVIGSLKLTGKNSLILADETAWLAAMLLFYSTIVAHLAIRSHGVRHWQVVAADWAFIARGVVLVASVVVAAPTL